MLCGYLWAMREEGGVGGLPVCLCSIIHRICTNRNQCNFVSNWQLVYIQWELLPYPHIKQCWEHPNSTDGCTETRCRTQIFVLWENEAIVIMTLDGSAHAQTGVMRATPKQNKTKCGLCCLKWTLTHEGWMRHVACFDKNVLLLCCLS